MASPEAERAPRACQTCKARKRGCDKRLPDCGYCSRRGLVCRYDTPEPNGRGAAWVMYTCTPGPSQVLTGGSLSLPAPSPRSAASSWQSLFGCTSLATSRAALDGTVHAEVARLLSPWDLSDLIDERALGNLDRCLPVVSPQLLCATATEARLAAQPPPADFSLLLLAIRLLVLPPRPACPGHEASSDEIYQFIKILLAQVQAVAGVSTRLVQAALLACAYEHASDRRDAACVSIAACARMALVLGIDQDPEPRLKSLLAHEESASVQGVLEGWNVWWGIVILERVILSETTTKYLQPVTDLPGQRCRLPCNFAVDTDFRASPLPSDDSCCVASTPHPRSIRSGNTTDFARQAQATFFLDQILRITSQSGSADEQLAHLQSLDSQLLAYISTVTDDENRHHCGALAIAFRALFLLQNAIMARPDIEAAEDHQGNMKQKSLAALDTASRIVAHAAEDHMVTRSLETLHMCCAGNLQLAMVHMQTRCHHPDDDCPYSKCLVSCMTLMKALCKRWST